MKPVVPPDRLLPAQLKPWIVRADSLVRGKVEDAAAHAARIITKRLKATADGRATARLAARSPSYQAAGSRLDELLDALAGPGKASLKGLLRDARERFFRDAFDAWKPLLSPDHYRLDAVPTAAAIATARGAIIHGYDLRAELAGGFATAKRTLAVACNLAGHSGTAAAAADDLLERWAKQTADRISRECATALGDAQLALFWAVETLLQKPK